MNKEWEVKFESLDTFQTMDEDEPLMIGKNAAKNFIRSLLASQRETLAVEIDGLKKSNPIDPKAVRVAEAAWQETDQYLGNRASTTRRKFGRSH